MPSLIPGYGCDVFISYRQNDNRSGWVTEFVKNLQAELSAVFKEPVTVYFDTDPREGLQETHVVDKSIERRLRSLVFIPVLSQTYCDEAGFAWKNEFCVFNRLAKSDRFGINIDLRGGNVGSRILPIRIHDMEMADLQKVETELGNTPRPVDFVFRTPGVNRPLTQRDDQHAGSGYTDQVNKVANAVKEIIVSMQDKDELSGGKRQRDAAGSFRRSRRLAGAGLAALIAVVFLFVYKQEYGDAPITDRTIAVLAFVDMSPNHDQEYFSDGLSDEIISALSNLSELQVTGRTSSFYFKGKNIPVAEIGKQLGVNHLVEGSVRRIDNQLRITVQVIRAKDGFRVFSQTYDRPATDLFKLQTEIAENIAGKFIQDLRPKNKLEKPASLEAYEYYLRGMKHHLDRYALSGLETDFDVTRDYFMKSLALDPRYTPTHGALADLYDSRGNNPSERTESWRLRDSIVTQGLNLNPNSAYVLLVKGLSFSKRDVPDLDSAFHYFRRAYMADSSHERVKLYIGLFYKRIRLYDQAMHFFLRCLELDPLNPSARSNLGLGYAYMGDWERAEREISKLVQTHPVLAHLLLIDLAIYKKDIVMAKREINKILQELDKDTMGEMWDKDAIVNDPTSNAKLLAAEGKKDEALKLSKDLEVLLLLEMKREAVGKLDTLSWSTVPRRPTTMSIALWQTPSNLLLSINALDSSPLWRFARNDPDFQRIRERVRKDTNIKLAKYGGLK